MRRFESRWATWETRVRAGEKPTDILPRLSDQNLVELLAGAGPSHRYERNLVATELLNRLAWMRRELADVSGLAADVVEEARIAAATVVDAVRDTERAHLATGEAHAEAVTGAAEAAVEQAADRSATAAAEVEDLEARHLDALREHATDVAAAQERSLDAAERVGVVRDRIDRIRERVSERLAPAEADDA